MPSHDYSAGEALRLLLDNVTKANPELGTRIEIAINEGKEVQESTSDLSKRGRRPRTPRYYRKDVPFTDEEALKAALTVLESHLIETRMFARAAHGEFHAVGMTDINSLQSPTDKGGQPAVPEAIDSPKVIEIELESETVQSKRDVPNHILKAEQDADIDSLRVVFSKLRHFLDFGEPHGNIS